jgi:hypothetical protein
MNKRGIRIKKAKVTAKPGWMVLYEKTWTRTLKVHKHEILFNTFFAETESLWSQGPVTRDFWKSYSIPPRYSTFKHFHVCSGCDKIISPYAQHVCICKTVHIFPLADHMRKFVRRMLSVRWNRFLAYSVCDKIVSAYAQHVHAIIFENYSKIPN